MQKFLFLSVFLAVFSYAKITINTDTILQSSLQSEENLDDFEEEYTHNTQTIKDPLIGYNRWMHRVNFGIYDYLLNPVINTYNYATPLGLRIGIYNFFDNLSSPLRFLASLFAGEPKKAMDELGRFTLNSTVGMFGIFDIALENGLYSHHNDFGITFGKWGFSEGFHLVLPLLGPNNLRDILAIPFDTLASPLTYLGDNKISYGMSAVKMLNYTARHKATLDALRQDSLDSYLLFRDAYEQRRTKLILE